MRRLDGIVVEEGQATLVSTPDLPPPWRSAVLTRIQGRVLGYWNVCRHIPIPLDGGLGALEGAKEWVCSTHGARFRARDGMCVEGPCEGLSLHRIAVEERDGEVWAHLEPPADQG
ncbi:MAG: Rieske 2Fe-2S domain-containing protein [Myxococcota bacterium]